MKEAPKEAQSAKVTVLTWRQSLPCWWGLALSYRSSTSFLLST